MVLFRAQSLQTQCFQRFAGFLRFLKMSKNNEKSGEKVKNNATEQAFGIQARLVLAVDMAKSQCLCGIERLGVAEKVECP